jgi:hypothetical protein
VELTGHTYACNNLTNIEHEDWKRKLWESAETCLEKFVKSHQMNLFLVDFSNLEPLCAAVA